MGLFVGFSLGHFFMILSAKQRAKGDLWKRKHNIRDCAVQTMNLTECFDIMNNGHGFLLNERREWYRRHLQQTRINSSACFNIFEHVCYVKLYFGLL